MNGWPMDRVCRAEQFFAAWPSSVGQGGVDMIGQRSIASWSRQPGLTADVVVIRHLAAIGEPGALYRVSSEAN